MSANVEKQIREIFEQQQRAWNAGDGNAWSAAFAEDAEFINIRGTLFKGRGEIAARHSKILATFFRGSVSRVTVENTTWVTPDLAIVRATHDVTGYGGLPPGIQESEKRRLTTRMTAIVRKTRASTYEIVFAQNTAVINKEER